MEGGGRTVKLVGDVALVTGGARGIGRACVEALVAAGCRRVYSADLAAHDSAAGAEAVVLDVADPEAVAATFAALEEPVQVLVNNAGVYTARDGLAIETPDWLRTFDVIAHGTFYCTREAAARLVASGLPGAVVNIASIAGKRGFPMQADYCAAKAAVLGFTRAAALDLAPHGITVNAICPGTIDTPMMDSVVADLAAASARTEDEQRTAMAREIPIGRMQRPDEIAAGVVYLASDAARAVTGEALTIDGGQTRD
jgi:NAD(P)-dependent dehydrogenase (short-subunit alcohol dehydrogenase family)